MEDFITVNEKLRIYHFPNNEHISLAEVESVSVGKDGVHRINTKNGRKVIVPNGWLAVEVDAEEWSL